MKLEKILAIATFIMIVTVAVWAALRPDLIPRFNLVLLAGLIAVTTIYAYSTIQIARASKEQAEEMREQRIIASRPVIIQEAIPRKYVTERHMPDYFQISNVGSSPAIDLEISILKQEKSPPICPERKTLLRAGEQPIQFTPFDSVKLEESTYYLACEYQSIFSRVPPQTWYQTWLPFEVVKASKEGRECVKPGKLEFREVSEKERIDAFGSRSKPK